MNIDNNRCTLPAIIVYAVLVFLLILSGSALALDSGQGSAGGLSRDEAIRLGERMYREGILPSGEPMQALVQGDIPVDSRMFSCASCHLRSGLGSIEGRVVTYPIDGITLFKPMTKAWNMRWVAGSRYARAMTGELRSAYNDETLAAAIRGGVNPDGKTLNSTMPRYPLDDKDMAIMIFYLKNLSVKSSPGVDDKGIHFAAIVIEGAKPKDISDMMDPLKTMADLSRSGNLSKMARLSRAADPEDLMNKGYVNVSLSLWELKGPKESWRGQLENYYRKEPVFAFIGGISDGDWAPVHKFCEEEKIPCILPIVDIPAISEADWYTIYFSKGLYQEGETAARYLKGVKGMTADVPVVEVYRDNERGRAAAAGFDETWEASDGTKAEKLIIPADGSITDDFRKKLSLSAGNAVVLAWLDSKDIAPVVAASGDSEKPRMIFMSSTLLGPGMYDLPDVTRKIALITYPYRVPEDFSRFQPQPPGSEGRYITLADYNVVRGKANLDVMLATKAIFMLKGYYNRDRFLEVIDMMKDELMVPLYPRLSFGPGQRYISKGCYIVRLGEGPEPKVTKASDWVVP